MLSRTGHLIAVLVVMVSVCVLEGSCKECKDSKSNCAAYGANVCKDYAGWASDNCQRTCGFCIPALTTTKAPVTRPPGYCGDEIDHCSSYLKTDCTKYKDWARTKCKKTCGLCSGVPPKPDPKPDPKPTGGCSDTIGHCSSYLQTDCTKYKDWARTKCPKTCGLCQGTSTGSGSTTGSCPSGWTFYNGDDTCLIARSPTSWPKARIQCQGLGGDLVIIRDKTKNTFVADMFPVKKQVWIGVKNVAANANDFEFKYVSGKYIGKFAPWESNNPDNYNNQERCVSLNVYSKDVGYWNDLNCDENRPYVCQKAAQ